MPRLGQVTRFASRLLSVRAYLLHALLELSFVRILVTTGAGQIIPTIERNRLRPQIGGAGLMTVTTWNRDMPASQ